MYSGLAFAELSQNIRLCGLCSLSLITCSMQSSYAFLSSDSALPTVSGSKMMLYSSTFVIDSIHGVFSTWNGYIHLKDPALCFPSLLARCRIGDNFSPVMLFTGMCFKGGYGMLQ